MVVSNLFLTLCTVEKNEIRDEKLALKANNEKIEQQLKTLTASPAGYLPAHPVGYLAAANKMAVFPGYGFVPTWQYLPPSVQILLRIMSLGPQQRSVFFFIL
ncbi:Detected protein of confused Function [Hibiscus syriacus]|uniref:Detected protein of confused Function n=1 Tax=Hibiscus syriacus TaxID=106335 RepID=A0A6A3CDZ0_HIBSY|nr:Detected protein of confused Function [Hibiscus syriacus]